MGLEKEDYENKIDSEETLHRASNVTAGLRAGSKKQYGWLTSSVNKPTSLGAKSSGKVASDITARGESGLKFREAREEPGIVMRIYSLLSKIGATAFRLLFQRVMPRSEINCSSLILSIIFKGIVFQIN